MRAAAHDLANLLTIVLGQCAMARRQLERGDVSAAIARWEQVEGVTLDCVELLRTKFLSPRPRLPSGKFDLCRVARKTVGQIESELADRGIEVRMKLPPLPLVVEGDEMELQRALFNLCLNSRNAIAGSGLILIAITAAEPGRACVQVRDSGHGMSRDQVLALWTSEESQGEHGHGLFVVKQAVEGMGGSIEVWSEVGSGTVFTLWLPMPEVGMVGATESSASLGSSIPPERPKAEQINVASTAPVTVGPVPKSAG